jgi:hypothetical protein
MVGDLRLPFRQRLNRFAATITAFFASGDLALQSALFRERWLQVFWVVCIPLPTKAGCPLPRFLWGAWMGDEVNATFPF